MGCYDTVIVNCPRCGTPSRFQSKGGECLLREFKLEECPADVLSDVNRHAPNECSHCGCCFRVRIVPNRNRCSQCGHETVNDFGIPEMVSREEAG